MSNSLSKYLFIIIVSFLSIFLVSFYVLAWTGPTANPPNENAATPLNVSNNAQAKIGPLGIDVNSLDTNYGLTVGTQNAANGLKVTGNSYLENNAYIMGNVGIGTTNPGAKLEVAGQILSTSNNEMLGWRNFARWHSYDGSSHYYWNRIYRLDIGSGKSNNVTFQVLAKDDRNYPDFGIYTIQASTYYGGSVSLAVIPESYTTTRDRRVYAAIDSNGYVWVKAEAAWSSLVAFKTIQKTSGATELDTISYQEADPSTFIVSTSESKRATWPDLSVTHTRTYIYINNSGNVGIGTTNPGYKLDVNGQANATQLCINGDCKTSWGATGVQGSGTTNYVAKFTGSGTIGNSSIFDNGTNVGIGTTAPSQKLEVNGVIEAGTNFGVQISGSGGGHGLFGSNLYIDSSNNYITPYTHASYGFSGVEASWGGLKFLANSGATTGSVQVTPSIRMYIKNDGNVGIGTTNPGYKLDVNGDANANRFCINGDCINSWGATGVQGSGTTNYVAKFTGSGTIGNSSIFDNGTNVGIGTTNPGAPLSVVAASSGDQALSQKWQYTSSDNYNLRLKQTVTSGVVRWTFDQKNNGVDYPNVITLDRGNVGIGTTNPGAKLEVNGKVRFLGSVGNTQFDGTGARIQFTRNSANYIDAKDTSGYLSFGTGGIANRVIIDSSGNVGIATTSPAFELDVNGQANATQLCINGDCKTSWGATGVQGSGTTNYVAKFTGSGTLGNSSIFDNGTNVGIGTTGPGAKLDVAGAQFDQSPASGNYWVNYYLGRNADPNPGDIILLIPNPAGTVTGSFMEGTITASRGSTGAYRSLKQWHISVSRAYTTNEGSITPLSQETAMIKLVTCDYNGQNYIAIDTSAIGASAHRWKFTGSWLNTINSQKPTLIPRASCSNIADHKTYHALGNQIAIDTSGNVGIGTTGPAYKLDVNGQANATQLCINGDCKSSWSQVGTSYWSANGNNIYNTNSGNVGIGTTNPSQKLDIAGGNLEITGTTGSPIADTFGGNTQQSYIHFPAASGSNDPGYIMHETRGDAETNEGVLHLAPSDDNVYGDYVSIHGTNDADMIKLHTSGDVEGVNTIGISISAERIDFDAANNQIEIMGGNVGIGTTNPAEKLEVNGTVKIQNFRIKQISSTELGFYDSDNNLVFEIDNGS